MASKVPSILIGLPTRNLVQAQTVSTLFSLTATPNVRMALAVRLGSVIQDKRNKICEDAIKRGDDYVFFIDSDMELPHDTLERLIKLNKDVVGALYFRTYHPYEPNLLEKRLVVTDKGKRTLLVVPKKWPSEPFKCWSVATGAMLIKTSVLIAMQKTLGNEWFRFAPIDGVPAGEDVFFCNEVQKAGFEVWCDPTIKTKHWDNYGFSVDEYNAAHGI